MPINAGSCDVFVDGNFDVSSTRRNVSLASSFNRPQFCQRFIRLRIHAVEHFNETLRSVIVHVSKREKRTDQW
jgi:hypothetical protein